MKRPFTSFMKILQRDYNSIKGLISQIHKILLDIEATAKSKNQIKWGIDVN